MQNRLRVEGLFSRPCQKLSFQSLLENDKKLESPRDERRDNDSSLQQWVMSKYRFVLLNVKSCPKRLDS